VRLLILIAMAIVYLALAVVGGWAVASQRLRLLAATRLDRLLHRGKRRDDAYIPWGRTSQAMGWYGAGLFVIGISVALGPFDNGAAILAGLPVFIVIWFASAFVGFFATARAKMLFVFPSGRAWEFVLWLPVIALLVPPILVRISSLPA
jgi:hypothetical protein